MADHHEEKSNHPYHLVDPSPWPLLGALAGGVLFTSLVLYMNKVSWGDFHFGLEGVWVGLALVLLTMWVWWKDIIKEAFIQRAHSPVTKVGLRYGMALFICSEVMFFAAFFWAYFNAALYPHGGTWPPEGIHPFDPFHVPFIMTLILLLSGTTVTWAHHAILEGHQKEAEKGLLCTIGLGALFTCFQAYEYSHAHFGWMDGVLDPRDTYASTFFMATGFHGLHVLIGTIFLIVTYFRTKAGQFTPKNHFGFEAAAWYWHFVDVVWLFLFTAVYWWGYHGAPH